MVTIMVGLPILWLQWWLEYQYYGYNDGKTTNIMVAMMVRIPILWLQWLDYQYYGYNG